MDEPSFIIRYIQEQISIFNHNLDIVRKKSDKKAIHDLRVAIKNIRSFLRLADETRSPEWKNEFLPVKNLFKSLGCQRDFDMSLAVLSLLRRKEKLEFPVFRKFLVSSRRFARQLSLNGISYFKGYFPQTLQDYLFAAFGEKTETEHLALIKKQVIIKFRDLKKLRNNFDKQAHDIRKMLKDVFYRIKTVPANSIMNITQLKQFDRLLDELGRWQDQVIFLENLQNFRKKYLLKGYEEYDLSKAIEKIAKSRKKVYEESILKKALLSEKVILLKKRH